MAEAFNGWCNYRCLQGEIDHIPPLEAEISFYTEVPVFSELERVQSTSTKPGPRQGSSRCRSNVLERETKPLTEGNPRPTLCPIFEIKALRRSRFSREIGRSGDRRILASSGLRAA